MDHHWSLLALVSCLLACSFSLLPVNGEATTQKAVPLANTNSTVAPATTKPPATTEKPKIKIADSNLCKKKCKCDFDYFQIDCSSKSLKSVFTKDDWNTLVNGDVTFNTIKLNNNSITHIPVLPAYPVENLYLSFNQINNITLGAFQNLNKLAKLDLSHNNLTTKALDPDVFKGVYSTNKYEPINSLIELDLAYNDLHALQNDLFEHVPNLEILILCKNTFQVIDTSTLVAIASLTSLKTLDMSYMEISKLPETIFHSPRDLETLLLSGNLFREVPDALKLAINLKKLVLDENPLGDFVQGNFSDSLKLLQYLSISYLPDTTRIGSGALNVFANLSTLVATDNPNLVSIDKYALAKNTSSPLYFDYPPLKELYLNNNNLRVFEREWIERWDKVTTIDFRYNPWTCVCTNSFLINTLMQQINSTCPMLAPEVKCATPEAWKGKKLLSLIGDNKDFVCEKSASEPAAKHGLTLISILLGVIVGVSLTLGAVMLYRRGCFGIRNRINPGYNAPGYNRANFAEDFHI